MGEKKRRLALSLATGDAAARAIAPRERTAASADDLLTRCRALLHAGRVREALPLASTVLQAQAKHPEATHLLGLCLLAAGQREAGLAALESAVATQPAHAPFRASLGRALVLARQMEKAAIELERACSAGGDAESWRDLGAVLLHLGRAREAEDKYREAALRTPERADLHEALARLQYRRDALDEAVASYQRAVALQPALAQRLNIGWARHQATGLERPTTAIAGMEAACAARSLLVIDDFLDDPHVHRQAALALDYRGAQAWAGINYPGAQTTAQSCEAVMRRIADALGRDIKWDSPDTGAFRISLADANARCDIHVDSETDDEIYAAVLYLSRPEDCRGGTRFWRHRETGWERRPSREALAEHGYASFLEFERRWMPVDRSLPFEQLRALRDADWECVFEVPMRFNRLIVYRSDFFHAIGELFGDRPENARMVQLFYFQGMGTAA